ncbi:YoaK family protein [Streptomyces sp. NPDC000594]|uniref:YoaK family protein n=1 Tax=Streptomyces sp. NPDC000594 TaxID=3154261 RepID=UPI00332E2AED
MQPTPGTALTTALTVLTVTTGMVEAVSFLVLGPVFTAVQTGNLLLLGFAVAGEGGLSPAASVASLGGFTAGALLGARLTRDADRHGVRWFPPALLTEAALLTAAALVARAVETGDPTRTATHHAVTAIVGTAMGLRNVTTLRARVPDLSTTVATRSLTALFTLPAPGDPHPTEPWRIRHRLFAVGAMFAGGLLGAALLHATVPPYAVLLTVAAAVLLTAAGHTLANRRADNRMRPRRGGG